MTLDSDYSYSKKTLIASPNNNSLSSSLLLFPHEISIGSFKYSYSFKNHYMSSSLSIINYGEFTDSESQHSFSSSDYILKHTIYKKFNNYIHSSVDLKYISSTIDDYNSDAIVTKLNLYYHYKRLLIQSFISNHGFVFNSYTSFQEKVPSSYGFSMLYLPQYINSIVSITYNIFDDYDMLNFQNEFLVFNQLSIICGYHSIAYKLYSGDFNNDFLIGLSIGSSIKYKDYILGVGLKNLGPIGIISSFTLSKSIN